MMAGRRGCNASPPLPPLTSGSKSAASTEHSYHDYLAAKRDSSRVPDQLDACKEAGTLQVLVPCVCVISTW